MGCRTSCRGWGGMGPASWVQLGAVLTSEDTQHHLSHQDQLFRSWICPLGTFRSHQSHLLHFCLSFCQVTGVVSDADGKAHYVMSGTWDEKMECSKIVHSSHGSTSSEGKQKTVYQTLSPKVLWKKYPLP